MRKIKKLTAIVIAFAIVASNAWAEEKAYEKTFADVPETHWAFEYIADMAKRDIISGYPDGTFLPEEAVSRAEFARILASAAGLEIKPEAGSSFADVSPRDWYFPYIEAVKDYFEGYNVDKEVIFVPNDKALREDIATAMVKVKGYDAEGADISTIEEMFTDCGDISEDAKKYIATAVDKGLIAGYPEGTFLPQQTITRAEAASLLWRAFREDKAEATEPTPTPAPTPTPEPTPTPTPAPTGEPDEPPHSNETTLAVVQKGMQNYIPQDGDDVEMIQVLYKGIEKEKLILKDGLYAESGLGVGDVFFFGTDRFGYVDEIYLIYDYSENEFMSLTAKDWSANLWDEGKEYQLAQGYIADFRNPVNGNATIMLAACPAIEGGYLDTSIDVDDDHENGVGVFAVDQDCLVYEYDPFNEDIIPAADRFSIKNISSVKASRFDKFEADGRKGVYEGDLISCANYAVVIIEDGVVTEIYTIVK